MERQRGKVLWHNGRYGFIRPHEPGAVADVFVSGTALNAAGIRAVEKGDVLEFSLTTDRRGRLQAANLALIVGTAAVVAR